MNHADRIAIRPNIVARCAGIVTQLATYILGNEQSTTEATKWAREAIRVPLAVGDAVSWHVISDPAFLADGSSIAELTLQSIVETAINKHFIEAPPA